MRPMAPTPTVERQISVRQLVYLLVVITAPTETLYVPRPLFSIAGTDTTWSVLLAMLGAYGAMLAAVYVVTSAEPMPFPERARKVLGPVLGACLSLLFAGALAVKLWPIWGGITYLLGTALLPHTPAVILVAMILALCFYIVRGGVEVAARMVSVLIPLTIVALLFLFGLSARWFQPENLYPIFPTDLAATTNAASFCFTILMEIVMVAYLGAFCDRPEDIRTAATVALLINAGALIIIVLQTLLMFGPLRAVGLDIPPLSIARTIHYGFILERLDVIVTPHWTVLIILKLCVWSLVVGDLVGRTVGRLSGPIFACLLLAASAGLSLLTMHNLAEVKGILETAWSGGASGVALACVLLLAVATAVTRRRKSGAHA